MANQVAGTASLSCTFGTSPSTLTALPTPRVTVEGKPAATVMDFAPMANIAPFGMCTTPSNPQVAAATAAAQGVLTPQPCIPVTTSPWTPGAPTVRLGGNNALDSTSQCTCAWGGMITIAMPATTKTMIP